MSQNRIDFESIQHIIQIDHFHQSILIVWKNFFFPFFDSGVFFWEIYANKKNRIMRKSGKRKKFGKKMPITHTYIHT